MAVREVQGAAEALSLSADEADAFKSSVVTSPLQAVSAT